MAVKSYAEASYGAILPDQEKILLKRLRFVFDHPRVSYNESSKVIDEFLNSTKAKV
jgi:hypothetical protein